MRYFACLTALLVLFVGSSASANIPKILKVSEVKAGTEAIGFSVFKGVEPEPFKVVLGEPIEEMGTYLILIRISGGPMDTPLEDIGAISGMSGSPIFVGCKEYNECVKGGTLVGALSYSIGYFIEGGMNAAMTPAEYMLGARFGGYLAAKGLSSKTVDTYGLKNLMLTSDLSERGAVQGTANQLPRCSGFANSDIKPGSMITIYIAKGTISAGVSGTVTWRDGEKIYAFGHPFTGSGIVNYPLSQISVADTLQTPLRAHKIPGCELPAYGTLLVDGAFEVAGAVGLEAKTIPFNVHMFVGRQQFGLEEMIVPDSPYTAMILKQAPLFVASQVIGGVENISVAFQARVIFENQPEVFLENILPAGVFKSDKAFKAPFTELFDRLEKVLAAVNKSGFSHQLESIHVDLTFLNGLKVWTKKDAFLSKANPVPGETVYLQVVLERTGPENELKYISIPIIVPKDFVERPDPAQSPPVLPQISVTVQDGAHFVDDQKKLDKTSPSTLGAFIERLKKEIDPRTNVLYVQESIPKMKEAGEKPAASSAQTSVGKWKTLDAEDAKQILPKEKFDISVQTLPVLEHYIELDISFTINVDLSDKKAETKSEKKPRRKWFIIF